MEPIPIEKEWGGHWIKYDDQVFVIEPNDNGTYGNWQCDGTMCRQAGTKGFVVAKFKTASKWFNETWWYKKTSWGENYPQTLYFDTRTREQKKGDWDGGIESQETFEQWINKTNKIANKQARPAEKILKAIFREVNRKTGMNLKFDGDTTDYGVQWWEAYVPAVDEKGNVYIITWMNCD